ncbi:uncharacterized protein LOC126375647 isoform X2 [Pectinophora gossypiella]|uniref:uncharacterized protein LOC126375647 isoform X2 n=1 Tax=Pectinophora gossypiella TaxID=13191 RepID=UPI00214EEFAA|nr:uncharacterized protein LOC126375647 isoform X2 [Pectinophora gossypiella]
MSKRFIFPQQNGDRKRAKLDVTVSDHNFPLSQNGPNKESDKDNWGDDNDDEILLLASQACEDAYNDISSLPDYSMCMQPGSTSTQNTQISEPGPSTSKAGFTFKKPSSIPSSVISTNLKDKYNRISSPLPGMTSKVLPKHQSVDLNSIFNTFKCSTDINNDNEKIYKSQDSEYVYRQLLQLQEENAKLKSENGKLLEKCVTKEGEASILRTQLKSCQVAVDNARMEKIKAQEKVQMEWTEKLAAANGQMHELRTQLDFKNLEIISVKERCRMLESNKVKLTQVTVTANDVNSSHKHNTSTSDYAPPRRVKVTSSCIQTEDKAHFLKLNKTYRSEPSQLTAMLPIVLEPTTEQHSILEYNEKLQKQTDLSQNKCRIYSTFHRIPSTPAERQSRGTKVAISSLHEDLTSLAAGSGDERCFTHILCLIKSVLQEACSQLELVAQKVTTSFLKQMDEKYVDATATLSVVAERDLLRGKPLYKEEQAMLARRMTAVLAVIIRTCTDVQSFKKYEDQCLQCLEIIHKICGLLDSTSCALLYSGLLLSITGVIDSLIHQNEYKNTIDILRSIISSRPLLFVSCQVLKILRILSKGKDFLPKLCPGGTTGNLRLDYDQGVLLYKRDSCYVQILLKQVEVSLKCIESQWLIEQAVNTTRDLITLYSNTTDGTLIGDYEKLPGCDCQLILLQVIVYALRICAVMLKDIVAKEDTPTSTRLLATCRSGILILYQCVLRDVEFTSQLAHNEGHLLQFCETMRGLQHSELYANMLSELSGTFQSSPEDAASSFSRQPWLSSFGAFSIAD